MTTNLTLKLQKLQERGLASDDLTWHEIEKFKENYINIDETLQANQQRIAESEEMKKEIQLLKNALNVRLIKLFSNNFV